MNQMLSLCLAANLVFAQTAVVRDSWFGFDKIKHFFMSAFIESVAFSGLQATGVDRRTAFAGGIGAAAAFSIGREIHDRRVPGNHFSYRDLTWDAVGATAGAVLLRHTTR